MFEQNLQTLIQTLSCAKTASGKSLVELTDQSPVLLLFLRHAGCTFCREAIADLGRARDLLTGTRTSLVLVHMGDAAEIDALLRKAGLSDIERICDPTQLLYRTFGLKRGNWRQLFGLKVLLRGLQAGLLNGHGIGRVSADSFQMPGVFLIDKGRIVRRFRHATAADRPDYLALCAAGKE